MVSKVVLLGEDDGEYQEEFDGPESITVSYIPNLEIAPISKELISPIRRMLLDGL